MTLQCRSVPSSSGIATIVIGDPGNPLVEARFVRMVETWPRHLVRAVYRRAVDTLEAATDPDAASPDRVSTGWARGSSLSVSYDERTIIVSASCIESGWERTRALALAVFDATAEIEDRVSRPGEGEPAEPHTGPPESAYAQLRRSVMTRALATPECLPVQLYSPVRSCYTTTPSEFAVIGGNVRIEDDNSRS
ncbi:hypothetical protein ACFWDA_15815 [Rhodococcus zopfii]|uniref:hypothetical protein n=1 Tax=Rhodococcus zopfii TaxID=43772 RepID=UPI000934A161|nr:hypothetical protein [Rhodococcus zopfii]